MSKGADQDRASPSSRPPAAVHFRRALPADVPQLVAVDAASPGGGWGADAFRQEMGLAWSRLELAEVNEGAEPVVVGFVLYWVVADEVQIFNVAVRSVWRRRGVATALLGRAAAAGRAQGASRVLLEVRRSNEAARSLYRRLGFVETGVRRGYYQREEEDAVLMEYTLATE